MGVFLWARYPRTPNLGSCGVRGKGEGPSSRAKFSDVLAHFLLEMLDPHQDGV